MFFELQAVPQIVTKAEQYEDARDELLRKYQAFTRFALSRSMRSISFSTLVRARRCVSGTTCRLLLAPSAPVS